MHRSERGGGIPEAMLAFELMDIGASLTGTAALVVVTPGVQAEAYLGWVHALEEQGLDAWLVRFPAPDQTVEAVSAGVAQAYDTLSAEREVVVAAHGYGGTFVLLSGIEPARMALVGTPLGPHAAPLAMGAPPRVVAEELPCPLVGDLPLEPYAAEVGLAYRAWTTEYPTYTPPTAPTLLVSSGLDCVAPPETVRLPSQGWPDRHWERTGRLGLDLGELDHAMLLSDEHLAHRLARFLAE